MTIIFSSFMVNAEGTKEFRPDSTNFGVMQINDLGRPFALESNTDTLHRLYFHISNYSTEKVYIGFNHIKVASEVATYRIMNPNGSIAKARANIPTSGTGFIKYYANAVAGPKIATLPAKGYTPIVFTPTMNGDFYIEFTTTAPASSAYHFDLFDLTVATSTANRIKGRLWSYCWDMNLKSYLNRCYTKFYSYSADGYVTQFDMNGIQPYGFTVSCNNSGPTSTDRKSVDGNSTYPQYKIFLNDPDPIVYISGAIPLIIQNLELVDTPFVGQPAKFTIEMTKSGIVEMVIELNGTPGYQSGTEDISIVLPVTGNSVDTVEWDGIDGLGNQVDADDIVVSSASFYAGITHFPLYDPETSDAGYTVNRIRPVLGPCKIYWDDSNFPGGTTNITGTYGPAHTWAYFFGDLRTMNSWWDGFRIDTMASFTWKFKNTSMPVELLGFTANVNDLFVNLNWLTASETNNDYFIIEKNRNLKFDSTWNMVSKVVGQGTTNSQTFYTLTDEEPYKGLAYYRLKQYDYDGKLTVYDPIVVNWIENENFTYTIAPNPTGANNATLLINNKDHANLMVVIYDVNGNIIHTQGACIIDNCVLTIDFSTYENGIYFISIEKDGKTYKNKIIKED
jgi:hypothetical protein